MKVWAPVAVALVAVGLLVIMQQGGAGALEYVSLENGRARARVCTYAAHVLDLTLDGEVLFVSQEAVFARGKAIRGG